MHFLGTPAKSTQRTNCFLAAFNLKSQSKFRGSGPFAAVSAVVDRQNPVYLLGFGCASCTKLAQLQLHSKTAKSPEISLPKRNYD